MPSSFVQIDASAKTPLHEQIFKRLAALITQGRMQPGSRAPSLRTLAMELGVARGTVETAYDRLIGEGFLIAKGPAGTFVADEVPRSVAPRSAVRRPRPGVDPSRELEPEQPAPPVPPGEETLPPFDVGPARALQMGLPALDEFPRKIWSRLIARQARGLTADSLVKPEPGGLSRLREALAVYLHRARGVEAQASQIFVVSGYEAGLALTAEALLARGDTAIVECPSYPPTSRMLSHCGLKLRRIPIDEQGLQVTQARKRASSARLVVVTPTHQSPSGVSLALDRRLELLQWAAQAGIWVFEDDYDGEYRYKGHPLPALKSLDAQDRVIYAGTLSKVLYPGLRLAYLVVPRTQVAAFNATAGRVPHGGCPSLMQAVVADFIEEGHFARHIRRMRTLYAQRRTWLADALIPYETHGMRVTLRDGGMHLLIELPLGSDDVACALRAQADGLGVIPLSPWREECAGDPALLASFTNIRSADSAHRLAARLAAAIGLPSATR